MNHSAPRIFAAILLGTGIAAQAPAAGDTVVGRDRPRPVAQKRPAETVHQHGDRTRTDIQAANPIVGAAMFQRYAGSGQPDVLIGRAHDGNIVSVSLDAPAGLRLSHGPADLPAAMRIPAEALDVQLWLRDESRQDHASDYEVEFPPGPLGEHYVQRRSGHWLSTLWERDGTLWLDIRNRATGGGVFYSKSSDGHRRLNLARRGRVGPEADFLVRERAPGRPDEMHLGERCQWWNMAANLSDTTSYACLTSDGIPLKWITSRLRDAPSVATRLRRGPVPKAALLPPSIIPAASEWFAAR